jgi:hypothetical protein
MVAVDKPKPVMELNEKQKALIGSWAHESAVGSDILYKKLNINYFLRQVAKLQKPIVRLKYDQTTGIWHFFIESAFRNHDYTYKINERFLQKTIDYRYFWCTTTLDEDGTQIDTQEIFEDEPDNIPSTATRFVENGKLVIIEESDGVISRRTFTRIEE